MTRLRQLRVRQGTLAGILGLLLPLQAVGLDDRQDSWAGKLPPIADKTAGLERRDGLLVTYVDWDRGRVWLEVPPTVAPGGEVGRYLYLEGVLTGLGSNPVGIDRGQLGTTRLVRLRRVGGRLLVEEINLRYRALSEDEAERRAVEESFATSVLWGGEIGALDVDGRALVDFTPFLLRDAHNIAGTLQRTGQGSYSLDPSRSAVDLDACLAFPDNLEFEALLTFGGKDPGSLVAETAPSPDSLTFVQHHSLIRLPPEGYRPRRFDPRAGSFAVRFVDYAAPLDAPLVRRWIVRHRLEKVDPEVPRSRVKRPIVYYVDRGIPEPVRGAVLDGAGWWARAFEEGGFEDAFRVELLPEGAHPLDLRYNVIQWVHRSTRGWSYGGGVIDPRTGEMLKGHVTLGSLRVRHDRLLFEGLVGTEGLGKGGPHDPIQLALARIRQLAAHEVGHTLGLSHNFAASTYGRASVMDYPAPLIRVTEEGELDLSAAYGVGVGSWDLHAIRYAYSEFPPGVSEEEALEEILREGIAGGLLFLTDQDARPAGAAHPLANLWDNGADPVAALEEALEVRRIALARFGEGNLPPGQPLALLQETLAPLYFHHRYQLQAAAKMVGGLYYTYAVRGDGQPPAQPVAAAEQRRALRTLLKALDPGELDLPDAILHLLLPRPAGYPPNRELFRGATAPVFDPLGAAATAADLVVQALLQPERAARLVDFHRRNPHLPGLEEVLRTLVIGVFREEGSPGGRLAEIHRVIQWVTVARLLDLAASDSTTPAVRATVEGELETLNRRLGALKAADEAARRHLRLLQSEIGRFLDRRIADGAQPIRAPEPPPGDPIGVYLEERGCSQDSWTEVRR